MHCLFIFYAYILLNFYLWALCVAWALSINVVKHIKFLFYFICFLHHVDEGIP